MADPSKRQLIFAAFRTRLKLITIANGYQTDAGKNVFIGESVRLAEDDVTHAIAVDILKDIIVKQESGPAPTETGAKAKIPEFRST